MSSTVHGIQMDLFNRAGQRIPNATFRWHDREREGQQAVIAYQEARHMDADKAKELVRGALTVTVTADQYGKLLGAVAAIGAADLHRKESKGKDSRTLAELLEAQCLHFPYLVNHALRLADMSPRERSEHACGTGSNEAFHREVATWGQSAHRQQRSLLVAKFNALLFVKLSAATMRLFHTTAKSQSHILQEVAAQLTRSGEVLVLYEADDVEHLEQQDEASAAASREAAYQASEKSRKVRLAIRRGIRFVYPRRDNIEALRRIARQRTFQHRSSGQPDAVKSKSAVRSAKWRLRLQQQADKGFMWRTFRNRLANKATETPPSLRERATERMQRWRAKRAKQVEQIEKPEQQSAPSVDKDVVKREQARLRMARYRERKAALKRSASTAGSAS